MIKLKFIIPFLIIIGGIVGIKSNNLAIETKDLKQDLFSQYLKSFKHQTLPFKMDRGDVLRIGNSCNSFVEIDGDLSMYIPVELRKKYANSKFRSLYVLPDKNMVRTVLLLNEFINEYDTNVKLVHMVTYNEHGRVLDYKELAGSNPDIWESFFEINDEYILKQKYYQFRINKNPLLAKYFHLIETCCEYELTALGLIEETNKVKREGYFEGHLNGYTFIK